jgi:predicted RNA-binding Zn-ribbon protein involved in translation (DUF1610 family)
MVSYARTKVGGNKMNAFAFKCPKCGTVVYSNTARRVSMQCPKCGKFGMVRNAKNDARKDREEVKYD